MSRYPKRLPKERLGNKRHHPPVTPKFMEKSMIRGVYIHECAYTPDLHPVCPHCGQYRVRILSTTAAPPQKYHLGTRCYICLCIIPGCNILYRYYHTPSLEV